MMPGEAGAANAGTPASLITSVVLVLLVVSLVQLQVVERSNQEKQHDAGGSRADAGGGGCGQRGRGSRARQLLIRRVPHSPQVPFQIELGLFSGRGAEMAEDAQETPNLIHTSPSILVYEDKKEKQLVQILQRSPINYFSKERLPRSLPPHTMRPTPTPDSFSNRARLVLWEGCCKSRRCSRDT